MEYRKYSHRLLRHTASIPFIWMMLFPLVTFDMFLEIYHHICFPLYGIALVKRSSYLRFDRHKLKYLNMMEKVNCTYCSYANGLILYACVIAGKTEQYWCGIQHEKTKDFIAPEHQKNFIPYEDEEALNKMLSSK